MKIRAALIAAALLTTGVTAIADAGTTVCKLVKDVPGDAYAANPVLVGPTADSLDIVSADIASDAKTITGVVRVKKFARSDTSGPLGRVWYVQFNAKGAPGLLFLSAGLYPNKDEFSFGFLDMSTGVGSFATLGSAKGVFDEAKNEIRISASIADMTKAKLGSLKPGSKFTGLLISARRFTGQNVVTRPAGLPAAVPFIRGLVSEIDGATGGKTYTAGVKSCVKPGK